MTAAALIDAIAWALALAFLTILGATLGAYAAFALAYGA